MDKTVTGTVKLWDKSVVTKNPKFFRKKVWLESNGTTIDRTVSGWESVLDDMEKNYPMGSFVELKFEKEGDYWNFKGIREADNTPQATPVQPFTQGKERNVIVRQNSLRQANAFLATYLRWAGDSIHKLTKDQQEMMFFEFAEKCEQWCLRPAGTSFKDFTSGDEQ